MALGGVLAVSDGATPRLAVRAWRVARQAPPARA